MNPGKIDIQMLANLKLGHGSGGPDRCLLESVSLLTGEKRTDRPSCVAPSLIALGIRLNDTATDAQRQTLTAFVPRLIGTAGDDAAEERRKYLCIDAAVREFAPLWLERAGLSGWAEQLRALPEIVDAAGAATGRVVALEASTAAYTAYTAAAASYDYAAYTAAFYASASSSDAADASAADATMAAASYSAASASNAAASYVAADAYADATAASTAFYADAYADAAAYAYAVADAYADAARVMGMWERLRSLYDRTIRASETPLDLPQSMAPAVMVIRDRVTA